MKDKVKYILELPIFEAENKLEKDCDIMGLKFTEDILGGKTALKKYLPLIKKPLMISGTGNDSVDRELLPELIKLLDRECIIAYADENTYKDIVPLVIQGGHRLVIRTPIDINLAKEMNILTSDLGLPLDKIIIDTDIGGLGYGLEYGYSIMEKIKLEGKSGDKYLDMPLISFAAEETAKTKEAKDESLALFLEIASASAVKAAGADYIVLTKPDAVSAMRRLA